MLRKLSGITFSCILTLVCSRNACKSKYDNKTNGKSHMFFKGLYKSIKITIVLMIFAISYLTNTMHPNQNDKNYNTILAFLLGWPGWLGLPGWPGVAGWHGWEKGPWACFSIWTIQELSGNYLEFYLMGKRTWPSLAWPCWLAWLAVLGWLACLVDCWWFLASILKTCPLRCRFCT